MIHVDEPSQWWPRLGRVATRVLLLASLTSVWWVDLTPLRTKALLVFVGLLVVWLILGGVRAFRGKGVRRFAVAAVVTLLFAVFALTSSLWVGPMWQPTFSASPVDLNTIVDISRFRSCAGHDYSGAPVESPGETESDRSMKHYLSLSVRYGDGTPVEVRSMADGVVTTSLDAPPVGGGSTLGFEGNFAGEVGVTMSGAAPFGYWEARYMHVHPTVAKGTTVKAGDVIGLVPPSDWSKVTDVDGRLALLAKEPVQFDVALSFHPLLPMGKGQASYIRYLSPELKTLYDAKGFSAEATMITKAERDARPCKERYNDDPGADWVNADAVRTAADKEAAAEQQSPTSTVPNQNNGQTSNPNDPFADRPVCNGAILGVQWQAQDGSMWTCMKTAEGAIAWGPG